jgi:nitroreductase
MDALEAIETCTAMRYLRPDPVPDDLIRRVIAAATCASSPGNSQGWDFVVVRDAERRTRIARAVRAKLGPLLQPISSARDEAHRRMLLGAHHLLDHFAEVPVLVFVCARPVYPPNRPSADWIPSTVYPAAQNLIVAARALGLGSVFTAFHAASEREIAELLGLPAEVRIYVTIPLGFPARKFARVRRRPLDTVLHWERF